MFNSLIGIALAVFGGYSLYTHTGDFTPQIYAKFLGMILVGGGVVIYNMLTNLPKLSFSLPNLQFFKKEDKMGKELSPEIHMKTEEEQDNAAIFYLVERLKDNAEAVELLRKVNDCLFILHHPKKV